MSAFDWGPLIQGGPLFIGILNLTPDSFSDGGRYCATDAAVRQALGLVAQGAGLLDLGAESTRPGATPVPEAEEWRRLGPVLEALVRHLPEVPLSLDTRHGEVAQRGLDSGVAVLNDVTGFASAGMLALARQSSCGLIAMRSRRKGEGFLMPPYGEPAPKTHQAATLELEALREHLQSQGIQDARILLDPGFGFGTTYLEDLALWQALPELPALLGWPRDRFCLGISRKRFVAMRAGTPDLPPTERDPHTALAQAEAMELGYRVFRTHAIG